MSKFSSNKQYYQKISPFYLSSPNSFLGTSKAALQATYNKKEEDVENFDADSPN